MKKNTLDWVAVGAGILLTAAGWVLLKTVSELQGFLMALPYVCIGLGCGIFGHGAGDILARRAVKNNPDLQKQIEIDKNDERNVIIANRAKAKAYDIMLFVFGALMVSFSLMGVELYAILLLVFAYLFIVGCSIYYQCRFDKEM